MKNYFSIANNILTGSLRPWANENQDDAKFGHLLNQKLRLNKDKPSEFCNSAMHAFKTLNFITENENLEELRELSRVEISEKINIEIPQFFNKQTEFYSYLITNSFHNILSGTFEAIKNSEEIDGTYKLFLLLTKLETLISFFKYDTNANNATILIMNTLGLHLFVTHSVLNQKFKKLIDFEVLSENEVLYQLCPELESEKSNKMKLAYYLDKYISTRNIGTESLKDIKTYLEPIKVESQETPKNMFTPILDDNRPLKKGVAKFNDMVRNPHRFGLFEEKLFQNDFISEKYAYCGKQGYKNQLAIIFHLLIEKNYFKKFNDSNKKKIDDRDVVKFLIHRYDVDVDKQFRSFKKRPDERAKYIDSAYWLIQLPMC